MTDYASFRQRLDAVLRTRDVKQISAFLIAENQWSPDTPSDPEFAMWLMIAATPTLRELHSEARRWLITHGHEEEAEAVLSRAQSGGKERGEQRGQRPGTGQQQRTGQGQPKTSPSQNRKRSQ